MTVAAAGHNLRCLFSGRRVGVVCLAAMMFASSLGTTAPAQMSPHIARASLHKAPSDLSKFMVDSTMERNPDPQAFGQWEYFRALYLFGQYMVYKRTGDAQYLQYVKSWVDSHVDADGNINRSIDGLDYIQPANLLLVMYEETHEERYKLAAEKVRSRIDTYPRTVDGGFWHSSTEDYKKHELWLDGTYMSLPFLVRYAKLFGGEKKADDEAVNQLLLDYKHNKAPSGGLLYHAYDETGRAVWSQPGTHHSGVFWSRSIGWYGMALVDILDVLPKDYSRRAELVDVLQALIKSLAALQDPTTGLWYQIPDQPHLAGNWLETSSSSMFTYIIDVAVKRGYVAKDYHKTAVKAYAGVLSQITVSPDGLADIHNVCEGTDVGDAAYYLGRKRNINDLHGLGAFLLMNEEWTTSISTMHYPQ